jgi:ABC-type phosphate/phosphonate transport system substrate-binding protein
VAKYFLALLLSVTALSGSAFAQQKELRISAIPDENPQELLRIYQPFADYLTKETG